MLSQRCKLTIDDEKYEIKVNVGSMIEVEQLTGKQFMEVVDSVETGSFIEIAQLLGCCLFKENEKKPVGYDFILSLEFDVFQELLEPLIDSIVSSFPQSDKKKRIQIIAKTK